ARRRRPAAAGPGRLALARGAAAGGIAGGRASVIPPVDEGRMSRSQARIGLESSMGAFEDAETAYRMATAAKRVRNYALAESEYRRSIRLNPGHAHSYKDLGAL